MKSVVKIFLVSMTALFSFNKANALCYFDFTSRIGDCNYSVYISLSPGSCSPQIDFLPSGFCLGVTGFDDSGSYAEVSYGNFMVRARVTTFVSFGPFTYSESASRNFSFSSGSCGTNCGAS